jgi:hypothetical protein
MSDNGKSAGAAARIPALLRGCLVHTSGCRRRTLTGYLWDCLAHRLDLARAVSADRLDARSGRRGADRANRWRASVRIVGQAGVGWLSCR